MPQPEFDPRAVATALLGRPPAACETVAGGGNARVYRVTDAAGRRFAMKRYPDRAGDPRDRLGAEAGGLAFLAAHGLDSVPRPFAWDCVRDVALFDWIEGSAVDAIGEAEVDDALEFLARLHELAHLPQASGLPEASEACLSAAELERQLVVRLGRLARREIPEKRALERELDAFLQRRLMPAFADAVDRARDGYVAGGWEFGRRLPATRQTLSPSDFGFHNARRRPDGRLVYLDFEYFGRDDPVKLTADVLLHPGMALSDRLRARFRTGACVVYGADPGFARRLHLLMPLYAIRWTLILLNEFLPERWARRQWARGPLDRDAVLSTQLAKARTMLLHAGAARGEADTEVRAA